MSLLLLFWHNKTTDKHFHVALIYARFQEVALIVISECSITQKVRSKSKNNTSSTVFPTISEGNFGAWVVAEVVVISLYSKEKESMKI